MLLPLICFVQNRLCGCLLLLLFSFNLTFPEKGQGQQFFFVICPPFCIIEDMYDDVRYGVTHL